MSDDAQEIHPLTGPELFRHGLFHAAKAEEWTRRLLDADIDPQVNEAVERSVYRLVRAYAATAQAMFAGAQVAMFAHNFADDAGRTNVAFDPDAFALINRQWLDIARATAPYGARGNA